MKTATEDLENDHIQIMRLTDIMERVTKTESPEIKDMESIVSLIKNYADEKTLVWLLSRHDRLVCGAPLFRQGDEGLWYARSAEFMQQPHNESFRWLRTIGDTIFAAGTVALAWLISGLKFGWSIKE